MISTTQEQKSGLVLKIFFALFGLETLNSDGTKGLLFFLSFVRLTFVALGCVFPLLFCVDIRTEKERLKRQREKQRESGERERFSRSSKNKRSLLKCVCVCVLHCIRERNFLPFRAEEKFYHHVCAEKQHERIYGRSIVGVLENQRKEQHQLQTKTTLEKTVSQYSSSKSKSNVNQKRPGNGPYCRPSRRWVSATRFIHVLGEQPNRLHRRTHRRRFYGNNRGTNARFRIRSTE